jgi:hypothetical protein
MKADTQFFETESTESSGSQGVADLGGPDDEATFARSEENILRWMEYLPDDCICRMIEMKWDITT